MLSNANIKTQPGLCSSTFCPLSLYDSTEGITGPNSEAYHRDPKDQYAQLQQKNENTLW